MEFFDQLKLCKTHVGKPDQFDIFFHKSKTRIIWTIYTGTIHSCVHNMDGQGISFMFFFSMMNAETEIYTENIHCVCGFFNFLTFVEVLNMV